MFFFSSTATSPGWEVLLHWWRRSIQSMTKSVTPWGKEQNTTMYEQWRKYHTRLVYTHKLNNIYLLLKHVLPILEQYQAVLFRLMVDPFWWSLEINDKILQALCYLLNRQVDMWDVFLLTKTIQFPEEKNKPISLLASLLPSQICLQVYL